MLEAGTRPWAQQWAGSVGAGRPLRANGQPYRGVNAVNLWAAAVQRGFTSRHWFTFKGALEAGGNVRKGAKSELAFYVGRGTKTEMVDGTEEERSFAFLKSYCVFNADECEGLPAKFYAPAAVVQLGEGERLAAADDFVAHTGATIGHGGGKAYYRPSTDAIQMPDFGAFTSSAAYYGTLLHELTHWTAAEKRLDRTKGKLFGDPAYAFEELVAELGAAFLCADLAITPDVREDHASYIASWIKCLKADERAIFRAAALAERAAGFLHDLQPGAAEEEPEELRLAA